MTNSNNKDIVREPKNFDNIHNVIFNRPSKKELITSLILSAVLIVLGYFANNMALFTGEAVEQYYLINKIIKTNKVNYGDATYFNTSYDKELVPARKGRFTIGNSAITDRAKLKEFLSLLQKSNMYKFILLDIVFDDSDISSSDSALFSTIKECPRLVFVDHDSISFTRTDIADKAAMASYYATLWSSNFARYKFLNNNRPSIPLYMYEKINGGKSIKRYGFNPFYLYFQEGKLCQNSVFLKFDNKTFPYETQKENSGYIMDMPPYENVGEFLETKSIYGESGLIENLNKLTNNKIVVIGNLFDDKHDTYIGEVPGSVILMRAYSTLVDKSNIVNFFNQLYWFVVFFLVAICLIAKKPIFQFDLFSIIRNKKRSPLFKFFLFLLSIISFSFVLSVFSVIEYLFSNHIYALMLPIIYFSFVRLYIQFTKS